MADDRALAGAVRRVGSCDAVHSAAVLSVVGSSGAAGRCQPAAERVDLRERSGGETPGCGSRGGSRRGAVEHLCRTRRHPLLLAAQRSAPKRLFHADRGRSQRMSLHASGCTPSWRSCWRNEFPKAIAFVSPLELGPPVGWPIQYRVSGPDVERVREIALQGRADRRGQS